MDQDQSCNKMALKDRTVLDRWVYPEDKGNAANSMICTGKRAQTSTERGGHGGTTFATGVAMVNENKSEEC